MPVLIVIIGVILLIIAGAGALKAVMVMETIIGVVGLAGVLVLNIVI